MPLLPLPEGLGAQARVFQEGTDDCQLRLFGLRVGVGWAERHQGVTTQTLKTAHKKKDPLFVLTFKVLRRARTRCNLSLSSGSLALWVKQRRRSCRLQGLGSPRAVTLACSRARYSCSSPSNGSSSRPSDTRRSLPSDTRLSLLSTLNSRRSETPKRQLESSQSPRE